MRDHRLHVSASFGIRREVETTTALPAGAGLLVALLVAIASIIGILDPEIYARETASWRAQGVAQDWVDLLIAVPWLALAARARLRGSRRGALLLASGLTYTAYSFAIYATGVHFNQLFLIYCAILGVSVFGLVGLALPFLRGDAPRATDAALHRRREPARATRLAAGFLVATSTAFALLWLADDLPAVIRGAAPANLAEVGLPSNPVHVLDLSIVLPAIIASGVRLWRRRPGGQVLASIALGFVVLMNVNIAGINLGMHHAAIGGSLGLAIGFVVLAGCAAALLVVQVAPLRARTAR